MSVDQVNLPQSIVAELGKTPCLFILDEKEYFSA